MKHVPILFQTPMVQSIEALVKNQTRRTKGLKEINKNPDSWDIMLFKVDVDDILKAMFFDGGSDFVTVKAPYGKIGDVLWVRETWALDYFGSAQYWHFTENMNVKPKDIVYKASSDDLTVTLDKKWKPSIFMPKEACRIFLEVTDVRVERLHDISEDDAVSEGIECLWMDDSGEISAYRNYMATEKDFEKDHWSGVASSKTHSFFSLWESINGKESLESNPFVFAYSFKRVEKPENFNK